MNAGLDVVFNVSVDQNPKPLCRQVDVSVDILYRFDKNQFFLTDPGVENIEVQDIAKEHTNKALSKAVAEYYKSHTLYTFHGTDTKQMAAKLVLKSVIIDEKTLVITLGI